MKPPRQFDVCAVIGLREGSTVDLAVVLQDDSLDEMSTRVVAPLIDSDPRRRVERLTPEVSVDGRRYVVAVQLMSTISVAHLGRPVASIRVDESAIKAALDRLFFGV